MTKHIDKKIVRETEKAILVWCLTLRGEKNIWFPRSQVAIHENSIELTDWIAEEKQAEYGYICPVPASEIAQDA